MSETRELPPIVRSWPIIGSLPTFARTKDISMETMKLAETHGNIYILMFGNIRVVIVLSYELISEAFITKKDIFSDRPDFAWTFQQKGGGFFYSNGKPWEDMHRFMKQLVYGTGPQTASLEDKVMEEMEATFTLLTENEGKPIDLERHFMMSNLNILSNLMFGSRLEYADEKFKVLFEDIYDVIATTMFFVLENGYPLLRWIPFPNRVSHNLFPAVDKLDKIFKGYLEERKPTYDKDNIRDIFDLYIKFSQEEENLGFGEKEFLRMVTDIFHGGDASIPNLKWLVLGVAARPGVQAKCQAEIDRVVGRERSVRKADMGSLPFVRATIMEVQRLHNPIPLAVPHATLKDAELGGFWLPQNTALIPNIMSIHMDPKLWPEPEVFKPERFLDDKGNVTELKAFYPFGIGPRACPAEVLAKTHMFLFLSNVLQKFSLQKPEGVTYSFDGVFKSQRHPLPYKVVPVRRQKINPEATAQEQFSTK